MARKTTKKRKSGVGIRNLDLTVSQLQQRVKFANTMMPAIKLNAKEERLRKIGRESLIKNGHPEITNKRVGCKYAGWLEISLANRSPEWRLERMHFYGDWCTTEMLDEILPDIAGEDKKPRRFTVDLRLFDILGNEYKTEPLVVMNPKNMDDLESQVKSYCWDVVSHESFAFNLDECYAEIRA